MQNDEDVNVRVFTCIGSSMGTEENQVGEPIASQRGWIKRIVVVPLPKGQRKRAFSRQMLTALFLRISDYSLPYT